MIQFLFLFHPTHHKTTITTAVGGSVCVCGGGGGRVHIPFLYAHFLEEVAMSEADFRSLEHTSRVLANQEIYHNQSVESAGVALVKTANVRN